MCEGNHLLISQKIHRHSIRSNQNVVRVFSFILKTKHKTLHVKRAWAELENSAEKHSARVSIDRERENCIVNSAVTRFQLYIKRIHFEQV